MNNNLYVDIHILQDIPPSNINRDENGTPKQAVYGGANRLRVSSQAWKRATRQAFKDTVENLGVRTRRVAPLISDELQAAGVASEVADRIAIATATTLGIKDGKKGTDLAYLMFFSRVQLQEAVTRILDQIDVLAPLEGKELAASAAAIDLKGILGHGHSLDVALFGRMVADLADLNVDGAVQVAHALSTHAAQTEFDYFTAVDDKSDTTGAGMIGTVEFNSATIYRYATVGVEQLLENLGGDQQATTDGIEEFIRAFVLSMPTGHKTSFAPRTRPGFVGVIVREDQPVNFVSAFEQPIMSKTGMFDPSLEQLVNFVKAETARWGDQPMYSTASCRATRTPELQAAIADAFGNLENIDGICTNISAVVTNWLER